MAALHGYSSQMIDLMPDLEGFISQFGLASHPVCEIMDSSTVSTMFLLHLPARGYCDCGCWLVGSFIRYDFSKSTSPVFTKFDTEPSC